MLCGRAECGGGGGAGAILMLLLENILFVTRAYHHHQQNVLLIHFAIAITVHSFMVVVVWFRIYRLFVLRCSLRWVGGEVIPRSAPRVADGVISFVGARCCHLICRPSSWAKLDIVVSHFKQLFMAFCVPHIYSAYSRNA